MRPSKTYSVVKRILDIVISLIALLLLSWLLVIIILINLICTRGKPFYLDPRVGLNGKKIRVLKFTSMKYDAEENPEKYLNRRQMKQWKNERKVHNDPRVTGFGKFLRKTSLDELPQLVNILCGTLSVIGPRPITIRELMLHFTEEERAKLLTVKPGLTGNWAVHGRNKTEYKTHERQELELEYVDKISFKKDAEIFFRTFAAIFMFDEVK